MAKDFNSVFAAYKDVDEIYVVDGQPFLKESEANNHARFNRRGKDVLEVETVKRPQQQKTIPKVPKAPAKPAAKTPKAKAKPAAKNTKAKAKEAAVEVETPVEDAPEVPVAEAAKMDEKEAAK